MTAFFTERQAYLARRLFDIKSVHIGAFRLKEHEKNPDAPLSPIFFNLRTEKNPKPGPLTSVELALIGQEFADRAKADGLNFDLLAGVPNAADPMVEAMASLFKPTARILKLAKKSEGALRSVTAIYEGGLSPGEQVLLVDDLITKADSKTEAWNVLVSRELRVSDCLVLIDRCQGGAKQLFDRTGVQLHAIFTLPDLLDFYVDKGLVDRTKQDEILSYLHASSL